MLAARTKVKCFCALAPYMFPCVGLIREPHACGSIMLLIQWHSSLLHWKFCQQLQSALSFWACMSCVYVKCCVVCHCDLLAGVKHSPGSHADDSDAGASCSRASERCLPCQPEISANRISQIKGQCHARFICQSEPWTAPSKGAKLCHY